MAARLANAKIAQQLQERTDENRRVSGQLEQLTSSVKAREAIYRSHMEASGGQVNPAHQVRRNTGADSYHQRRLKYPVDRLRSNRVVSHARLEPYGGITRAEREEHPSRTTNVA